MFDVVVIGAGVVGGLVARELTKYQLSVAIVEKGSDVSLGATRANSAIVHAGFDAKEGSLKAKLNVEGSKMMESVAAELGDEAKVRFDPFISVNQQVQTALKARTLYRAYYLDCSLCCAIRYAKTQANGFKYVRGRIGPWCYSHSSPI